MFPTALAISEAVQGREEGAAMRSGGVQRACGLYLSVGGSTGHRLPMVHGLTLIAIEIWHRTYNLKGNHTHMEE